MFMSCIAITTGFFLWAVAPRRAEIDYAILKEVTAPRTQDQVYDTYDYATHHALNAEGNASSTSQLAAIRSHLVTLALLLRLVNGGFDPCMFCFAAGYIRHNDISSIHKRWPRKVENLLLTTNDGGTVDWLIWMLMFWW